MQINNGDEKSREGGIHFGKEVQRITQRVGGIQIIALVDKAELRADEFKRFRVSNVRVRRRGEALGIPARDGSRWKNERGYAFRGKSIDRGGETRIPVTAPEYNVRRTAAVG